MYRLRTESICLQFHNLLASKMKCDHFTFKTAVHNPKEPHLSGHLPKPSPNN